MLFICSVIFVKSRSAYCRRGTDTRKGRREGIRGKGRIERIEGGNIPVTWSHKGEVSHDINLNQKPHLSILLQNALKLTCSKVNTKKFPGGTGSFLTPASEGKGRRESELKERVRASHFFIQVYAYMSVVKSNNKRSNNKRMKRRLRDFFNIPRFS